MKPVFEKFNLRKSAALLAAVSVLSIGSAAARSNPVIQTVISTPADQAVTVNYVGVSDNSLVFRLDYENKAAEKFWLIIKDDAGDVVYEQSFRDVHFTRLIRLPKEDGKMKPTFVIRSSNGQIERQFEISSKTTEDIVVTKL